MSDGRVRRWLISLALAAPACLPYLTHYLKSTGDLIATGFIQYDMPYYMANAREYFDGGGLTYGNPFSPSYGTPAIYFQPLTLLLGAIWRLTGADPGLIFVCVGFIAAIVCARVAVALYQEVVGLETWAEHLGLVIFGWGGGLLALAGLAYNLLTGQRAQSIFRFDPFEGWWFLNFGRNMVYPTEALYHALFLGCVFCILKRRFGVALVLAFLVSISHPFTGAELLVILCAWSFFELYFMENKQLPRSFFAGCCGLLIFHFGYYFVFLNLFPEHRQVVAQWTLAWLLQAQNFIPAYILVGALAAWRMRRFKLAQTFFAVPRNRFFCIWFLVAFILANHEFAVRPVQPLHFTRGYIWMPLFLMGAPALVGLFAFLMSRGRRILMALCIALVMALFLSDNILWLGAFAFRQEQGFQLTRDERALFDWMNAKENRGSIILSRDPRIAYLAMTYTPLRAWYSHQYTTPQNELRQREVEAYFSQSVFLDQWNDATLLIVYTNPAPSTGRATPPADRATMDVFQNTTFTVARVERKP
ncbi:MAG: hypothetical protein WCF57_20370 [Pyrinomonadaceae bacterium]